MNATPPRTMARRVAIVGIGCRFPGGVASVDDYWRLLVDGRDAVGPIPSGRLDPAALSDPGAPAVPQFGGYVDDIELFDAAFFGISPREAEMMDPQQRLLLETAWEALEDAGQNLSHLSGQRGGVFVGQWLSDFEARLMGTPEQFDFFMTTGTGRYESSGRISAFLGWRGPSVSIDSACSSSLAAVHLAVRSIQDGDSDFAIAAGVNVILAPHVSVAYSRSGMLAEDGRCKFGDAAADGYVRSEGAAALFLKPLDIAIRDKDRVHAVILGSAVNNDGGSSGKLGRPSVEGQAELLRAALADAGIDPLHVGYVEAHGTGTKAGDGVELRAIGDALCSQRQNDRPLLVGSAKSNIGHTEGAAGLAGLIKAALSVTKGIIPPSLHCTAPNPAIPWDELRCRIATGLTAWPAGQPRIAGVNTFGISGTNAHILLGEPPSSDRETDCASIPPRPCVLPLSARSEAALRQLAGRYALLLGKSDAPRLEAVCRSAALRRSPLEYRAAFVADDAKSMAEALASYEAGGPAHAEDCVTSGPRVAFIAPGQGGQWPGMAKVLLCDEPVFRAALERCDASAQPHVAWSIVDVIERAGQPDADSSLDRIDVVQPVLVALSIAYAELLASRGVRPAAVTGHSMGEVAAACIAGVIDIDTAMRLICRRSALMATTSGQGAMALVELSAENARRCIESYRDRVSLAAHNGPASCVISGEPAAIASILRELEADGVFCRLVKVDVASHSPQMDAAAAALRTEARDLAPAQAAIPIYSTALGRRAAGEEFTSDYWGNNLRQPVLFADVVTELKASGINTFVELGPHPILLPSIQQTVPDAALTACGRRDVPDDLAFGTTMATLWTAGVDLDWEAILPGPDTFTDLPLNPWQRERHWHPGADLMPRGSAARAPASIDDEQRSWIYSAEWHALPLAEGAATLPPGPWLVAGSSKLAEQIAADLEVKGKPVRRVDIERLGEIQTSGLNAAHLIVAPGRTPDPYLPAALLRHLPEAARLAATWIVTEGAQAIGDDAPDVDGAALWGAARVAAEERPDLNLTLVDLSSSEPVEMGAFWVRMLGALSESQLAIRGQTGFGLRLAPLKNLPPPLAPWRPDASYLITGGLGDIGLLLARSMVDQGARRLVLLGRSPLPPRVTWTGTRHPDLIDRRIRAIRELEAKGASIHVACVDVADETALASFLFDYAAEGWPPIRGVVHAAGSFANALARDMPRDAFETVLGPKLRGAQYLDRLLPELDMFVLFSSSGALLPQAGQANYAAANAGLEAVARRRRLRGQHAACLAWGVWEATGLVSSSAGLSNVAEMERQGCLAMPPNKAAALFSHLLPVQDQLAVVCRMDWPRYVETRSGRSTALFSDLQTGESRAGDPSVTDEMILAPEERRRRLELIVRESVGQVLKIAPAKLSAERTFGSMGLNSLVALELRNRLEKALKRPLSATMAWNYPTIAALSDHLSGFTIDASDDKTAPASSERPAPLAELAAVDALSDEEALLALRQGRRGVPR